MSTTEVIGYGVSSDNPIDKLIHKLRVAYQKDIEDTLDAPIIKEIEHPSKAVDIPIVYVVNQNVNRIGQIRFFLFEADDFYFEMESDSEIVNDIMNTSHVFQILTKFLEEMPNKIGSGAKLMKITNNVLDDVYYGYWQSESFRNSESY